MLLQERHIEFDLAGIPNPNIPQAYLEQLANHLQFESILKYVALPRLTIDVPKRLANRAKKLVFKQVHPPDVLMLLEGA